MYMKNANVVYPPSFYSTEIIGEIYFLILYIKKVEGIIKSLHYHT